MILPMAMSATEKADTTILVGNKQIVVEDSVGKTSVKVFDINGDELHKNYEAHFSDSQEEEQFFISSPFIPNKVRNGVEWRILSPAVFVGFNMLTGSGMGFSKPDGMHVRNSKSWEWGIGLLDAVIPISRYSNRWSMFLELQFSQAYNHYTDDYMMMKQDDGTVKMVKSDEPLRKSYSRYNQFTLPIMVQWQNKLAKHRWSVCLGPSLDLRTGDHARYFIGKKKHTSANDTKLNALGLSMQAYIGIDDTMIYIRHGLTPLYDTKNAPKCYPLAIGIGFGW